MYVGVYVCVRACVRACMRECLFVCVFACVTIWSWYQKQQCTKVSRAMSG